MVTHSSGNHAQALALAARNCGIPAEIVMPITSIAVKIRAVKDYGGIVTLCPPSEQVRVDTRSVVKVSGSAPQSTRIVIMVGVVSDSVTIGAICGPFSPSH